MKKENWIIQILHTKKSKITHTREVVAEWLIDHAGIFSAQDILENTELDKVSVYRTIDLLVEHDIIHPVLQKKDTQFYEIHEEAHHHHIVCSNCDTDKCVPCDINQKPVIGFSNIHHAVVLTGICNSCT